MNNVEELTPKRIVEELDKYIVGQDKAKRAVAVALRNRYRRRMLGDELRDEVIPKNILMIGPTGVGKTEIARRLANLTAAPFIKVEATKFTEVGYVGRDVDSMIRDLIQVAVRMVENEKMDGVRSAAMQSAIDRILDILQPPARRHRSTVGFGQNWLEALGGMVPGAGPAAPEETEEPEQDEADFRAEADRRQRIREKLRKQIEDGFMDDQKVDIEVEETSNPFVQVFSQQGMEEMGVDLPGALGSMMPKRKRTRSVTVKEAKQILADEAARNMIDQDQVTREAIERTEESGIIFVDEMDKIAGRERGGDGGPQVSREGVQRDILPIIEGSTVITKYGPVNTTHILFVAAGAFHVAKPSDLIPELQGRLPIRVELDNLSEEDFVRILKEPKNALVKQYIALMATEGIDIDFTDGAILETARIAAEVNSRMENIGARRLQTIMERLFEEISFNAPDVDKKITIDENYVKSQLQDIVKDEDLSRYIL